MFRLAIKHYTAVFHGQRMNISVKSCMRLYDEKSLSSMKWKRKICAITTIALLLLAKPRPPSKWLSCVSNEIWKSEEVSFPLDEFLWNICDHYVTFSHVYELRLSIPNSWDLKQHLRIYNSKLASKIFCFDAYKSIIVAFFEYLRKLLIVQRSSDLTKCKEILLGIFLCCVLHYLCTNTAQVFVSKKTIGRLFN